MDYATALVAGGLAGTAVDLTLFPLDTLKTRLQAGPGQFWASGGFRGIYRGVGSAFIGSSPGAALFFVTYEGVKGSSLLKNSNSPSVVHMIAASMGEVAACAVRVPTEVVKQRAQAGHYASSFAALSAILRGPNNVVRELYRGAGATVLREVPFTMVQFPLWEAMKAWRVAQKQKARDAIPLDGQSALSSSSSSSSASSSASSATAFESAAFGSLAGGVAAAVTTPLDVLKTRIMLSAERQPLLSMVRQILAQHGVRPFFAGIGPRVTWISIGGAIFLGSYQWVVNAVESRRQR